LPTLSKNHDASFRHLLVGAFSQISWSICFGESIFRVCRKRSGGGALTRKFGGENATKA
jgi:hypothetical protein